MMRTAVVSPASQGVLPSPRSLDAHPLLAQLAPRLFAVRAVEAIEHQHAVEVVDLVQEHPPEELVALDDDLVTVEVEALHRHDLGAHDLEGQAGKGETPLFELPLARLLDDLRVEQH